MKKLIGTLLTAAVLMGGTSAFADEKEGAIAKRKERQQQRIAQGVKSGSLTPKETAHLENKEAKLNQETRAERKANGGNLTNKEKAQVNRQQNKLSNDIHKQKHDGQTQQK
jgi:hypothetical protein